MSEDKIVWIVDSEAVENKLRPELVRIPGLHIIGFRDVCDAIDALRNGSQKPALILANYHAADIILEVAHQKSRYAGVRTAYVCETDISHLAESHNAAYVRLGSDGNIDGLARLVEIDGL